MKKLEAKSEELAMSQKETCQKVNRLNPKRNYEFHCSGKDLKEKKCRKSVKEKGNVCKLINHTRTEIE